MSASQLLDRFAATQAQLKSFIAEYEFNRQDAESGSKTWKGSHAMSGETRFDGKRVSARERLWGQIVPDTQRTKGKPYYKSRLYDGRWFYSYEQPWWRLEDVPKGMSTGTLALETGPAAIKRQGISANSTNPAELLDLCGSGLALGLGALPHDGGQRFDVRLRAAAVVQVRDKLEPAGWTPSPCYVLDAETPQGHYTVWLDPAHGFQLAKAILKRGPGHQRVTGYTLNNTESDLSFVEKVRFEKSGEVWLPVETAGGLDNSFAGGLNSSMRFQLKVTRFILIPDHAALRSFLPDDFRDGARAIIIGSNYAGGGLINCQWRDGKIVDKAGNVVFDSGLKNSNPKQPIPPGKI